MPGKKASHTTRRELLFLFLLLLPLGIVGVTAYRVALRQPLNRALIDAIKQDDTKTAISLLAMGADANTAELPSGSRPVWEWVSDRLQGKFLPSALVVTLTTHPEDVVLVKALLDSGASVNATDADGTTPLMYAGMTGNWQTFLLLIARGAEINARNKAGATALYCVASGSEPSVVQLLLTHGAHINARTAEGKNSLHVAAFCGQTTTVRLLIAHGCEVNVRAKDGNTALSQAAMTDRADCVELLLTGGAQVNTRDLNGCTPLAWAHKNHDVRIVHMLQDAGAQEPDAKE